MKIGALYHGEGKCTFVVWAPLTNEITIKILSPRERSIHMSQKESGYWFAEVDNIDPDTRYVYSIGKTMERPDPASFFQPEGVHGPSQIIDHTAFQWDDSDWKGIHLEQMILYELHVGTFTPEGTFEAIIPRLDALIALGINAVNIMPVAQFPGERNWGYDGAYSFAVQNSYGGPDGLKKMVNACHERGIAVILDVVYNHLGPEGNYLRDFGPYFTSKYRTPWGDAINFDDAYSDEVRNYFIENAMYWFREYHVDGLRLDAIHGVYDFSARPFLKELAEGVAVFSSKQNRKFYVIAESDLNDVRVIRPREIGGYGIDAQWCDDFHHALHALLTTEHTGYYADFGTVTHLVKALKEGFVYSWDYSVYRKRRHGSSSSDRPARQFVVFAQNHDHIGNRIHGDRLSTLVSLEGLKLAAGAVLFSPYIPLLFMGEEYGEDAPFLYFVHHSDQDLIKAVRAGRNREFESFGWQYHPPDPQSLDTFLQSKLRWEKREEKTHQALLRFYHALIHVRKNVAALSNLDKKCIEVSAMEAARALLMHRWHGRNHIFCIMNFNENEVGVTMNVPVGRWKKIIDSADDMWSGPGSVLPAILEHGQQVTMRPLSFALYEMEVGT
jgi:maltooligosyltrehalose trehalohydrolase